MEKPIYSFEPAETLEHGYVTKAPTNRWTNVTIEKQIGIYFDLGVSAKTPKELHTFKNEAEYDKFVTDYRSDIANCPYPIKMQYDVQVREPNGCKVSYTFELFKKIIFPNTK